MKPKVAETARQERAQGGQPQAATSGDSVPNVTASDNPVTDTQQKARPNGKAKPPA